MRSAWPQVKALVAVAAILLTNAACAADEPVSAHEFLPVHPARVVGSGDTTPYGVHVGMFDPPDWPPGGGCGWIHSTYADSRGQVKWAKAAGARWIKVDLWLASFADGSGELLDPGANDCYEANRMSYALKLAADSGLSVLAILTPPETMPDSALWATFVRNVVAQYGDSIKYWEIGNEVNAKAAYADPDDYAKLVRWSWREINGNGWVVAGSVQWGCDASCSPEGYTPTSFLQGLNYYAGNYYDILSIHSFTSTASQTIADVNAAIATDSTAGWNHPLWLTEFSPPFSYDTTENAPWDVGVRQADMISGVFLQMRSDINGGRTRWEKSFYSHLFAWGFVEPGNDGNCYHNFNALVRPTTLSVRTTNTCLGVSYPAWATSGMQPRLPYDAYKCAAVSGLSWSSCAITASVSGPSSTKTAGTFTFTCSGSGGSGGYAYEWHNKNAGSTYTYEGVGSTQKAYVDHSNAPYVDVRCKATAPSNGTMTATKRFNVLIP